MQGNVAFSVPLSIIIKICGDTSHFFSFFAVQVKVGSLCVINKTCTFSCSFPKKDVQICALGSAKPSKTERLDQSLRMAFKLFVCTQWRLAHESEWGTTPPTSV